MKPLLFILAVTGLSLLVSTYISKEITWFTYYAGAMAGLLVSGTALEFWNRRKKTQEEEQTKNRSKRGWKKE